MRCFRHILGVAALAVAGLALAAGPEPDKARPPRATVKRVSARQLARAFADDPDRAHEDYRPREKTADAPARTVKVHGEVFRVKDGVARLKVGGPGVSVYVPLGGAAAAEGDNLEATVKQLRYDPRRQRLTVEAAAVRTYPATRGTRGDAP
jgi:hypothetical protein